MTHGAVLIAHNNNEIDYLKIACINALMIKKNLNIPVTLITDSGTLKWGLEDLGSLLINSCFEKIVEVEQNYQFKNFRNFSDTCYTSKSLQFYNCNHWEVYNISPYDETLFIDADYLILSNALEKCWNSTHDVMINHRILSPGDDNSAITKLVDDMSIRLYWATVIYFKKSPIAEYMFSIVKDVQENYQYYKDLYSFSSEMFRNDIAFSIAVHMLNGYSSDEPIIHELPVPGLIMSWDTNDIHSINGINDITLFSEKLNQTGEYILARIKNTDVHIMNKWAINRHADKLISIYRGVV